MSGTFADIFLLLVCILFQPSDKIMFREEEQESVDFFAKQLTDMITNLKQNTY